MGKARDRPTEEKNHGSCCVSGCSHVSAAHIDTVLNDGEWLGRTRVPQCTSSYLVWGTPPLALNGGTGTDAVMILSVS